MTFLTFTILMLTGIIELGLFYIYVDQTPAINSFLRSQLYRKTNYLVMCDRIHTGRRHR